MAIKCQNVPYKPPLSLPYWTAIFLMIAMVSLLTGCFATKVMTGINEPNLADIKPGLQRTDVEKILGERLWYVGVAGGLNYDIYQFKNEQPAMPMTSIALFGLDFISLGTSELWLNDESGMEHFKQVAVAYDDHDRVVFVTKPWSISEVWPCRRQRSLIPEDSGVPATARPEPVIGIAGDTLRYAKLEDEAEVVDYVDVHMPEENVVEKNVFVIPPGRREVHYSGSSVTVELLPGRIYRLKHARFHKRMAKGYNSVYWIEDVDSRETLSCVLPEGF
jgi:hypothetical protein